MPRSCSTSANDLENTRISRRIIRDSRYMAGNIEPLPLPPPSASKAPCSPRPVFSIISQNMAKKKSSASAPAALLRAISRSPALFIKNRAGGAARNRSAYGIPVTTYKTAEMQAAGIILRSVAPTDSVARWRGESAMPAAGMSRE